MQRLSEDVKKVLSFQGIEVASEGTDSLQLRTPGILYDVGTLVRQIEECDERAVIDATCDNGQLELVVTLPASNMGGTAAAIPPAPSMTILYGLSSLVVTMFAYIVSMHVNFQNSGNVTVG